MLRAAIETFNRGPLEAETTRNETLESLATFDGRRSPSAFTAVSAGRASPAVAEPAPPTPPKEREKRDSLLCDGDTVDAVLGSVFD